MCLHSSSRHWRLWLSAGLLASAAAVSACTPAAVPADGVPAPSAGTTRTDAGAADAATRAGATPVAASVASGVPAAQQQRLVPAGYGTLRQDEITVSIRNGPVLVKVTPLDEAVIRLLAPDTYRRLTALAAARREEAARNTSSTPELFMVSFFSYSPDIAFQPEDVQLFHQARLLRPATIIALSSGWGRQRLDQQETQTAIYAFEGPIDYTQGIRVRYGPEESNEWGTIISKLETERAKVLARVGG